MYLGTNFTPPVIHPTKQLVNHTFSTTVVPHIHPVHTTTINHHMIQHKHYCPQTASAAQNCCHKHINCCGGGMPQTAPTMTAPTMTAPAAAPNALPNALPNAPMGGRPSFFPRRRAF